MWASSAAVRWALSHAVVGCTPVSSGVTSDGFTRLFGCWQLGWSRDPGRASSSWLHIISLPAVERPSLPMGFSECQRVVPGAGPHVQAPVESLLAARLSVPHWLGTPSVSEGPKPPGLQTKGM